ncbi:ATP binding protein isoform 1 [Dorcoceras hygrometricum]|uniref:ATP binding protein isoform 1 n=1 Tax=Dorcoceras hygrometricum TaxID=472368 RepID=A0A2Z7CQ85_9LAMI|nr:ATP binding protein isoform 1 [Dorcoceras hygrometricum]
MIIVYQYPLLQIRSSLSSVRTLSQMLSIHMRRSEISYDIIEDILVQANRMRDTLQQLQDAVYMTKENIMRYNNNALKNMRRSAGAQPESISSHLANSLSTETSTSTSKESNRRLPVTLPSKDLEFPMPPIALAPSQHQEIRPCKVFDVLEDLVVAIKPLATKQQRAVELCDLSRSSQVAVDEPALRQALSNLIEGSLLRTEIGGKVEIVSTETPAGALIIIDDDGLDMHYMTQMHSLAPFGADLLAGDRIEDNMTWNFIAGLTVAREILESYGCVLRVISPRNAEAPLGAGGTRIELWVPLFSSPTSSDTEGLARDA